MTLDEIRTCPREFLIPREVAPLLGVDPDDLRCAARLCPERLGFNVAIIGHRIKIPRLGFIRWMEGRCNEDDAPAV